MPVYTGGRIAFEYQSRGMGDMPADSYIDLVMSPEPVKYPDLSAADQEGIQAGRAQKGMTKQGVMIALGYPARSRTPSIDESVWWFGLDRSRWAEVRFDSSGRVIFCDPAVAFEGRHGGVERLIEPPPQTPPKTPPGGQNQLAQDRREEDPVARKTTWTPGPRQTVWILAIGVGQYRNRQIPSLPFARKDAERLRDWFLGLGLAGVTRDNLHLLCDERATRENLLAEIDWLRKQALPEDAVFVYFACHGAPELAPDGTSVDAKYLVLHDTDPGQLFSTAFPLDDLTRRLDMVKAKTQVVILEACYAGPVGQEVLKKTPTADLEIRPRLIQTLGEKGGRVILSASSGRQMAIGSDEIGGALFTHYLLSAWGDGTERLLSERLDEASYQVRRASNRLGSLQEPAKFGDQNVDVILKIK